MGKLKDLGSFPLKENNNEVAETVAMDWRKFLRFGVMSLLKNCENIYYEKSASISIESFTNRCTYSFCFNP
jgi:hypothetical protein